MKTSQKEKSKRKKTVMMIGVGIVLVALLLWFGNRKYREYILDFNAQEGDIVLESAKNQQDANNFHFQIQVSPVFQDGMAQGELMIVNPEDNSYNTSVQITLDDKKAGDEERILYDSEILEPGERIRFVTLKRDLEKGTYPATAMFTIIDRDSGDSIGMTAAQISITVLE
jgi:nitrogen fixation-related uncharacterized protein